MMTEQRVQLELDLVEPEAAGFCSGAASRRRGRSVGAADSYR